MNAIEKEIQQIFRDYGATIEPGGKHEIWRFPNGVIFPRSRTAKKRGGSQTLHRNELAHLRKIAKDIDDKRFQEAQEPNANGHHGNGHYDDIPVHWDKGCSYGPGPTTIGTLGSSYYGDAGSSLEPVPEPPKPETLRMVCPNYIVEHRLITPEVASSFLELNVKNRRMSDERLKAYIEDMEEGRWRDNGDPIRFSSENILLDGQTRLSAIVHSGIPQQALIITDAPPEIMSTIDIGRKRTVGHMLEIRGVKYTTQLPAIVRIMFALESKNYSFSGRRAELSPTKVEAYILDHLDEMVAVAKLGQGVWSRVGHAPLIGGATAILRRIDQAKTEEFITMLGHGDGLASNSPIFQLRERLLTNRSARAKMPPEDILALIFKAWNHWINDRKIQILVWRAGQEDFPVPIMPKAGKSGS